MTTTLQQKLQLKPGQALVVRNPPAGYLDKLVAELKENVLSTEPQGKRRGGDPVR